MQTTIQFGNPSTYQEWSQFKGMLKQGKAKEELLKKGTDSENLVLHLTKQLQGGGIIKESKGIVPIFPDSLKQAS
jgi:hypothetical protein